MKYVPPLNALPGDEENEDRAHWNAEPTGENLPLRQGAYPSALGFEAVQREIVNAIIDAGMTPDPADYTQLAAAIAAAAADLTGYVHEDNVVAVSPAGAFGGGLFHVQDQKASGTDGGSLASGVNTRVLNTVLTNEITGASLTSNQVTLPAGTYYFESRSPVASVGSVSSVYHQSYLYNVTDASDIMRGTSEYNNAETNQGVSHHSFAGGRFTIAGAKTVELRHYSSLAISTIGLGFAASNGTEIYSDLKIWKVG